MNPINIGNKIITATSKSFSQKPPQLVSLAVSDSFVKSIKTMTIDKDVFELFSQRFSALSQDKIKNLYHSCVKADGTPDKNAVDTFFELCTPPKQTFFQRIFSRNNEHSTAQRYGINFIANMLEKCKDSSGNFPEENLKFAKNLLNNTNIINSSDYTGILSAFKNQFVGCKNR